MCEHNIALRAANVVQAGERYAYSHLLLNHTAFTGAGCRTVFWDVACLSQTWLRTTRNAILSTRAGELQALRAMEAAAAPHAAATALKLPAMHAYAHPLACRLQHSGAFHPGSGLVSGEMAEQFFSVESARKPIINNCSGPTSTEILTACALQRNDEHIKGLPETLAKR